MSNEGKRPSDISPEQGRDRSVVQADQGRPTRAPSGGASQTDSPTAGDAMGDDAQQGRQSDVDDAATRARRQGNPARPEGQGEPLTRVKGEKG